MADSDVISGMITVTCPQHHHVLIGGLWNYLLAGRGVDFETRWSGQSIRAHRVVLDVFLSPEKLREATAGRPPHEQAGLDLLMEFLYNGRVTIRKEQLESLGQVARDSDFRMLVDALESATKNREDVEDQSSLDTIDNAKRDGEGKSQVRTDDFRNSGRGVVEHGPHAEEKSGFSLSKVERDGDNDWNAGYGGSRWDFQIDHSKMDTNSEMNANFVSGLMQMPIRTMVPCLESAPYSHSWPRGFLAPTAGADPFVTEKRSALGRPPGSRLDAARKRRKKCGRTAELLLRPETEPRSNKVDGEHGDTDEPYRCDVCDMVFPFRCSLKAHSLVHTGEKPFKCPECQKCFSQRGNLKTHEMTHLGIKPFECLECHKRFSQRGNLKTHAKKHLNRI